jgi:autotransporter family porin
LAVGRLSLDGYGLGGCWTHLWPSAAYLDAVLMGSRLKGVVRSRNGALQTDVAGSAWAASLEAGRPYVLNERFSLDPQVQVLSYFRYVLP